MASPPTNTAKYDSGSVPTSPEATPSSETGGASPEILTGTIGVAAGRGAEVVVSAVVALTGALTEALSLSWRVAAGFGKGDDDGSAVG